MIRLQFGFRDTTLNLSLIPQYWLLYLIVVYYTYCIIYIYIYSVDSYVLQNDNVDTGTVLTTDDSITTSTASSTTSTASSTTSTTTTTTTLNLNMTAAELRRRLAESKKQDARRTGCTGDFRQKHDMVDKL